MLGCDIRKPEKVLLTSNVDYKVEKLFKFENCMLYKFNDGSNKVYFSNCGDVKSHFTRQIGKIIKHESIQTIRVNK